MPGKEDERALGVSGLLLWMGPDHRSDVMVHDIPWSEVQRKEVSSAHKGIDALRDMAKGITGAERPGQVRATCPEAGRLQIHVSRTGSEESG